MMGSKEPHRPHTGADIPYFPSAPDDVDGRTPDGLVDDRDEGAVRELEIRWRQEADLSRDSLSRFRQKVPLSAIVLGGGSVQRGIKTWTTWEVH